MLGIHNQFSKEVVQLFQAFALGFWEEDGDDLSKSQMYVEVKNGGKKVLTINAAMLMAKKMKYNLAPMFWIATGKNCPTAMDPIAPALAAMLRHLARMCVGKI